MTNITLYSNTASDNRVDKTDYLTKIEDVSGVFRNDVDIVDPIVRVNIKTPEFNYAYIEDFNRYYYVVDTSHIANDLWEISLHCDVLMTYRFALLNCPVFVDRCESETLYNSLIVDDKLPLKQGQTVTTTFIDNDVYTDGTGQFVLTGLLVSIGDSVSATSLNIEPGEEVDSTEQQEVEE